MDSFHRNHTSPMNRKHLLFAFSAFLALTPLAAYSSNFAFGFSNGLTLENQAVCLPVLIAHGYLLAVFFAFGTPIFVTRFCILVAGATYLAFESLWLHATLMDFDGLSTYLRWLSKDVIVFVVPPVFLGIVLLPARTFLERYLYRERLSILHLMAITLLTAILLTIIAKNQFARYLYDWSALGEVTLWNSILAFSLYMALQANSSYVKTICVTVAFASLLYRVQEVSAPNPAWYYIPLFLPWLIYLPAIFCFRRFFLPEKRITITNKGLDVASLG
jgi:hypothetical protein